MGSLQELVIITLLLRSALAGDPAWLGSAGDGNHCLQSIRLTAVNTVIGPSVKSLICVNPTKCNYLLD